MAIEPGDQGEAVAVRTPLATLRTRTGARVRERYGPLDAVFIAQLTLIALINAFTYNLFEEGRPLFLYPALIVNLGFLALSAFMNRRAFIVGVGFVAGIAAAVWMYSHKFDAPLNFAMLGSYASVFSVGMVGVYARRHSLPRALNLLFVASVLYAFAFLYFHFTINSQQLSYLREIGQQTLRGFTLSHGDSETFRIFVSDFNNGFGLLYALSRGRERRPMNWLLRMAWLALAAFFLFCFVIADFRFALATILIVVFVSLIPSRERLKLRFAEIVMVASMVTVFGVTAANVNMYAPVRGDITGSVRYDEAVSAVEAFQANPLFGTGIISNPKDAGDPYGTALVAPSDIGYLGMLYRFGIVGYILTFAANVTILLFARSVLGRTDVDGFEQRLVVDVALYVMLSELLSTFLLDGGGGVFLAFAIAYWGTGPVRDRARRRATAT